MRTLVALAVLFGASVGASAGQMHTYLDEAGETPGASLTYSECTGDEIGECISYSLQCPDSVLNFTVDDGPVDEIAVKLVNARNSRPEAIIAADKLQTKLVVWSVHLDANEMDGGWTLNLSLGDAGEFFGGLTNAAAEQATIRIGGSTFDLAPEKGDGAKLTAFAKACH